MGLRIAAALTGLVGGLAWIAALVFEQTSGSGLVADVLTWAGLVLLGGRHARRRGEPGQPQRDLAAGDRRRSASRVLVWSVLQLLRRLLRRRDRVRRVRRRRGRRGRRSWPARRDGRRRARARRRGTHAR